MTTKKTLINRMYRLSRNLLDGIHRDDAWQDLHAVINNLIDNNYDVNIDSTEYNGMQNKTYYISVNNLEHVIKGHITCAFCGSCESPMDCYDMSMVLY